MSEYIKEYFSSALDFAGEEQGDTYRKYCVIQLVGPLALGVIIFCMKLMIGNVSTPKPTILIMPERRLKTISAPAPNNPIISFIQNGGL